VLKNFPQKDVKQFWRFFKRTPINENCTTDQENGI